MTEPLWVFNPGPLPGVRNLWELARGLEQVRIRVDREGAGAISPWRQLQAVDAVLQQGQNVINEVMRGLGPSGGPISARDAFLYVGALLEHSLLILYWLRLGESMERLPPARGQTTPLTPSASQARRVAALRRIQHSREEIQRCLRFLWDVRPREQPRLSGLLRGISVQMHCADILGNVLVKQCAGEDVPAREVDEMLEAVARVRVSADFSSLPDNVRAFVWQTLAGLYGLKGDTNSLRSVLRERRDLIASEASRERQILQLMPITDDEAERFALLAELTDIARGAEALAVFSQERVGRLSVLKDVHWWAAASLPTESPYAAHIVDEAFRLQRLWLFGVDERAPSGNVRISADWHGRGRISWRDREGDHVTSFALRLELVGSFLAAMTCLRPMDAGAARRMRSMLATELGPPLAQAVDTLDEIRLEVGGSATHLPLLLTEIDGVALGTLEKVAFAHPVPEADGSDVGTSAFDLLIVDDCFSTADHVVSEARHRAERADIDLRVIRFDSTDENRALSRAELEQALAAASNALLFCHVNAVMWYANEVAIPTGPASRCRAQELVRLDLSRLAEGAVIACGSGQPDVFVGELTVAHALALAGASQVLYTQWAISAKHGAEFVAELLAARSDGTPSAAFLAERYRSRIARASP